MTPVRRGDLYPGTVVDGRRSYQRVMTRLATRVSRLAVRKRDRDEADLERRLRAAGVLTRGNVIVLASPKGGVGKTTCTFLIGATLASRRGLRVVAVDADHDVGTLDLLVPGNGRTPRTARQALARPRPDRLRGRARAVHGRASQRAARPRGPGRPGDRPEQSSRRATARSSRCSSASTTSCCSTSARASPTRSRASPSCAPTTRSWSAAATSSAPRAWPRPAPGCWTRQAPPGCGPTASP